jgi:hypothetical protein
MRRRAGSRHDPGGGVQYLDGTYNLAATPAAEMMKSFFLPK